MTTTDRVPRQEPQGSLQRLAAGIAPTWYAVGGLLIALLLGSRGQGITPSQSADAMVRPFVKSGDVYRFTSHEAQSDKAGGSVAPVSSQAIECSLELKIAIEGAVDKSAPTRLPDRLFVVHVFEMVIQAKSERTNDGFFTYQLFFERVRDVSLNAPHPLPHVNLQEALNSLPRVGGQWTRHVGQRRDRPLAISQAVFGIDVLQPATLTSRRMSSRAFWSVSSLESKSVRLRACAPSMVHALQPVGCDLSKNETDWLRTNLLLQWVQCLASGTDNKGPELSATTLSRIIPADLSFVNKIGSPAMATQPLSGTPESLKSVWLADLDLLTALYPPSVFMEQEYAALSQPQVTMTCHTSIRRE